MGDRAGTATNHFDTQIHLEPGEAHAFLSILDALRVDLGIIGSRGVCIEADLVAEFATSQQRVDGCVVNLSGDVPQRHFDGADATALPGVPSKLFDLAENPVEFQWVFTENAALQEQCVGRACSVPDFAEAVNTLIRID